MRIRQAQREDASAISVLAVKLTVKYIAPEFPDVAAKALVQSMSSEMIARNIENDCVYHLAVHEDEVIGLIGVKSNTHLYHLFVGDSHQRKGIAKQLWEVAKNHCFESGNKERITVNASLYAKAVYEKLGFVTASGLQERNGVTTVAMEYEI